MPEWFVKGQAEQYRVRWNGGQAAVTSVVADVGKKSPVAFERFARDHAAFFRDPSAALPS
jgi:hypothetical protein